MLAKLKTLIWSTLALFSSLLLIAVALLLFFSCHPDAKPSSPALVIYGDTSRIRLVHRADSSGKALILIHQRTDSTVTSYGKSVQQFDSIQVALP